MPPSELYLGSAGGPLSLRLSDTAAPLPVLLLHLQSAPDKLPVSESASQEARMAYAHTSPPSHCIGPNSGSNKSMGNVALRRAQAAGRARGGSRSSVSASSCPPLWTRRFGPTRSTAAGAACLQEEAEDALEPEGTTPARLESGHGFEAKPFDFLGSMKCHFSSFSRKLHSQIYKRGQKYWTI